MTPGARLAAAIEILDWFLAGEAAPFDGEGGPGPFAEPLLKAWARGARYAGSKDRAAVADLVYAALRRLGSARLGAAIGDGRAAALGALRLEGASIDEIAALADGGPHRPASLSLEERDRLRALPERAAEAPLADAPGWLRPALGAALEDAAAECAALARRAAFDFRVNFLKTDPAAAAAALAEDGLETEPGPLAPTALRATGLGAGGRPKLSGLAAHAQGLVEPQDAASQAAALLAAALYRQEQGDGEGIVLDACAGGGGKTLALAAALPRAARLYAFDIAPERMRDLPERRARAGARAELLDRSGLEALRGGAALALVDAPCSGSGAWARRPDAKWRLTPKRLAALGRLQASALDLGAEAVGEGGVLVYVTCSLLREENGEAVAAFLARRPDFERLGLEAAWAAAGLRGDFAAARDPSASAEADGMAGSVLFSPSRHGTDGFFVAALRRRGGR